MEMAVYNAPWPIGVSNAGIHAQPAREYIFSKDVAPVLIYETQQNFIQGLKRLITQAQDYFVTDLSRSVDFVRKEKITFVGQKYENMLEHVFWGLMYIFFLSVEF